MPQINLSFVALHIIRDQVPPQMIRKGLCSGSRLKLGVANPLLLVLATLELLDIKLVGEEVGNIR